MKKYWKCFEKDLQRLSVSNFKQNYSATALFARNRFESRGILIQPEAILQSYVSTHKELFPTEMAFLTQKSLVSSSSIQAENYFSLMYRSYLSWNNILLCWKVKIPKTLIQAEAYFSLMYRRYLKQMVGWKRAMEVQLNQRCLIEKLQKVAVDHNGWDGDGDGRHYSTKYMLRSLFN